MGLWLGASPISVRLVVRAYGPLGPTAQYSCI